MKNLTTEQKIEIETNCLSDLCEDMSFPANERLDLTELVEIHIQGLATCKYDTTLPCDDVELIEAAEKYLTNLYAKSI